jgi:hypothetical protein
MKIQRKLYFLCFISLGVGATAALYLILALSQANTDYSSLLSHEVRQADSARLMQVTFKKQVQAFKDVLLRGEDAASLQKYMGEFHANAEAVDAMAAGLSADAKDPETFDRLRQFMDEHKSLDVKYEAALNVFAAAPVRNAHLADSMVKGQDRAATDVCDSIVAGIVRDEVAFSVREEQGVRRQIQIICGLLGACFLGVGLISRGIIRRLAQVLQNAVDQLSQSTEQVVGAASQVAAASQNLAQGSSEQAATIENTSSAAVQVNAMAQRTLESSRSTSEIIASSQQNFLRTNDALGELIEAMDGIGSSSEKISKIIKVIEEIAFQTNILALNAAVEAARAGEAGLGFAVVADEVRNLSGRCAEAVKNTTDLIEESMTNSSCGREKVSQVAMSVRVITSESDRIKVLVDEINQNSVEQSCGIAQVSNSMSQMEQVTQSSAASAEQNAAAAEELDAQAQLMSEVVAQLRLGGNVRSERISAAAKRASFCSRSGS